MKLKYKGKGAYVVGLPARDLSAAEVKQYGQERLLASGLYEEVKTKTRKPKAEEPEESTEA